MSDTIINKFISKMTEGHETGMIRTVQVGSIANVAGCFIHFLFIFLFLALDATELTYVNIISVMIYLISIFLLKRKYYYTNYFISVVEINAHAFLCVYYIGWDFGFQYYILIPAIIGLVYKMNIILRYFIFILTIIIFILTYSYSRIYPVEWTGNLLIMNIIYICNITGFLFLATISIIYFQILSEKSEKKLNETNMKLESVGSSLKKYLPVQLVDSIIKGEYDAVFSSERKKLTIFFSDIKGFTEITDGMEPEELSSMLNEYITEMTNIAHRWGGTIDKFIGDAMMVFFGAPESTGDKDHAVRCVKMAMEMQEKMKELKDKWFQAGIDQPLGIRVGINTGITAVGNFGAENRLSYTAIGGQVNLASRLEGLALPAGILISHSTWAFVNDEIECRQRNEKVKVKGINKEIIVYDVVMKF